jgi:hypothetical protein
MRVGVLAWPGRPISQIEEETGFVYFELLHSRLVDHLRAKLKSGEVTERGLARLAGISQPHLHNVLKGMRELSPATADAVITNLRLSAFDLVNEEELCHPGRTRKKPLPGYRQVPLAVGLLGPDHPFPDLKESSSRLAFRASQLKDVGNPVAVCLAHDPNAPAIFQAGDIVLLEVFSPGEQDLQAGDYYAVEEEGCGLLRQYAGFRMVPGPRQGNLGRP